jgi:hypothetical protein
VCLHTFTVVKTSPTSRKASSSLQRLKRNLTILAKALNVTQKFADFPQRTNLRNHCFKGRINSDKDLVNAPATNTRKVMLFSKNKYLLQVTSDGSVNGTHDMKRSTGESNIALFFIKLSSKLPIFFVYKNIVRGEGFLDLDTTFVHFVLIILSYSTENMNCLLLVTC